MRTSLVFAGLLLACSNALGQSCDAIDYTAAKDQAAGSFPGRVSLATTFCTATIARDALQEQRMPAAKQGATARSMEAERAYEQCTKVRDTIRQALEATQSIYTLAYANGGCKGTLDPAKK